MAKKKKPKPTDRGATARRVARKVVGPVKPSQPIEPRDRHRDPKHKQDYLRRPVEADDA